MQENIRWCVMTEKCISTLYKIKYALGVDAFSYVLKSKQLWIHTVCRSDLDTPYSQQQPADHSPRSSDHSPRSSGHRDRLFQHISFGNLMRTSQKSLIVKNNDLGMKPVVLWVQSPHLLPAISGWPALQLSHCGAGRVSHQWTTCLSVKFQVPLLEMLLSLFSHKAIPVNTSHWAPANVSQTTVWSSLETEPLSSPVQTHSSTTSTRKRWTGPLRSACLYGNGYPERPQCYDHQQTAETLARQPSPSRHFVFLCFLYTAEKGRKTPSYA